MVRGGARLRRQHQYRYIGLDTSTIVLAHRGSASTYQVRGKIVCATVGIYLGSPRSRKVTRVRGIYIIYV